MAWPWSWEQQGSLQAITVQTTSPSHSTKGERGATALKGQAFPAPVLSSLPNRPIARPIPPSRRRSRQRNRRNIIILHTPHASRRLPLLGLQIQHLRRQRDDRRILLGMPDNTLITPSVIESAPPLPRPRRDRDGVQVCEVEAWRFGRSEHSAVEGFGNGNQNVRFDGRTALGAAAAVIVTVDDPADVVEGDVVSRASERLAVDCGFIGLRRTGG
jgi:hypothetical protein